MPGLTGQLQQNTPVLYIIIGDVNKEIYEAIQTIQKERIGSGGIAYVHICKDSLETALIESIKKVHDCFMSKQYLYAGEIRINYILSVHDSFSLSFLEIREKAEQFLGYLYPAGILIDVFGLIDDKSIVLSEGRHITDSVLDMLDAVSCDNCMVYLLSNVSSKNLYNDDSMYNIIHSIALITLIKDCIPLKPKALANTLNAPNRYSEGYFKKDSLKNGGHFMSIGYANIKKPVKIIKKIFLAKLLNFMDKRSFDIEISLPENNIVKTAFIINALELDNLMGIPVNQKQNIKGTINIQAIEILFGSRLDLYFSLNFPNETSYTSQLQELELMLGNISNDSKLGFFAAYHITSENGEIRRLIKTLQQENNDGLEQLNNRYSKWCKQKIRTNNKLTYFYETASQYLEFKWEFDKIKKIGGYLGHIENFIINYHASLGAMKSKLDSVIEDNNKDIEIAENALPFMNYSVRSFYETLLCEYLNGNFNEYSNIYKHMYSYLKNNRLEEYISLFNDYMENTLLNSEAFNKTITDETAEILRFNQISGDEVYSHIFNWITSNKQYNIFLKTGEKHLHSEINILIDVDSQLIANAKKDIFSKEHINLFYENNQNEIDILYHIGGFEKKELYYSDLYKVLGDGTIESG